MRVTLLHNPKAGDGEHEANELIARLKMGGHQVRYQSTKEAGWKEALEAKADVVLAAGGDGTVRKIARRLVGRETPVGVVPLGTANNLARTLGYEGLPTDPLACLRQSTCNRFDVGHARGPWGEELVMEGAGVGLLPDYLRLPGRIVSAQHEEIALSPGEEVTRHVSFLRRAFREYEPVPAKLTVDGEKISGRFLLLEALNIRSVGPILTLAPKAETADGYFDLVLARAEDRSKLTDFLEARLKEEEAIFPIPARRFQHLRMEWENSGCHIDDEHWPRKMRKLPPGRHSLEIVVEPGALRVLRPSEPGARA